MFWFFLPEISNEFGGDCSAALGLGRFTNGKEALYGIGGSSAARKGGGRGGGGLGYSLCRGTKTGGRTEERIYDKFRIICLNLHLDAKQSGALQKVRTIDG